MTEQMSVVPTYAQLEISRGDRFSFGKNWLAFLAAVDERRISNAEQSLARMLRTTRLDGKTFLDIGCGSGLSSLAACRLGAHVRSFDYDPDSVACTEELRRRYAPGAGSWLIERGSVLDRAYMESLGTFDVVYSWGVLHHTGRMWEGVEAACNAVARRGQLFIALYNDLGTRSRRWRAVKRLHNKLPVRLRPVLTVAAIAPQELKTLIRLCLGGHPLDYVRTWTEYNERGMQRWRDIVDWVGGYPYEFTTPDAVFEFCTTRGFILQNLKCGGVGLGCNEFVFERSAS
jgi:2-polyprenyl-6-hydroxyphenyl methylase/3-demethylubiquinone-9 3-methyltransferase